MNRIAAIQLASGPHVDANLLEVERLISEATEHGASLVVLPENFAMMGQSDDDFLTISEKLGDGKIQTFIAEQAKKHGIWIAAGTIPLKSGSKNKVLSSCLFYNDHGDQIGKYDKMHLFDVNLVDTNESYNESETFTPGKKIVVIDTHLGRIGFTVCYDLRFPELYRSIIEQGADIILCPAAFTALTGKAHWTTLLRARAIENLVYIIAAGQGGYHVSGRETHGDSMIVNPWGVILSRVAQGSGVAIADIDLDYSKELRKNFPCIDHRRIFCKIK
jgi:nitrilase